MYLIFAGIDFGSKGGLNEFHTWLDDPVEMCQKIKSIFEESIPGHGKYDWVHVGFLDYVNKDIRPLGQVRREAIEDAFSEDGWVSKYLESIACSDCKEPPGYCSCPVGLFFEDRPLRTPVEMQGQTKENEQW